MIRGFVLFVVLILHAQVNGSMFRSSFTVQFQSECESNPEISVKGKTEDNLVITTSLSPKKFLGREKTSFLRPWNVSELANMVYLKFECDNYLFPCKVDHTLSVNCPDTDTSSLMELRGSYLFSRTSQDFFISSFTTTMVFAIAVMIYSSRFWEKYLVYFGPKVGQQVKKCLDPPSHHRSNWLSDYFKDDLGDCSNLVFLPEYPSSFSPDATFKNLDGVYQIHDYPACDEGYICELRPNRIACVVGGGISVALSNVPSPTLMEHWRMSIPNYVRPVIKKLNKRYKFNTKKYITLFPVERVDPSNHLVDPSAHYEVLSKNAIPDMNVDCPTHYNSPQKYPCMIKATHGLGHLGTYRATTESEAKEIETMLTTDFKCGENQIVYTSVVTNIQKSYCAQFYLSKHGFMRWIGVSEQQVDEDVGKWIGGYLEYGTQPTLKDKCQPFCKPIAEYLHKKKYFGIVGVDILFDDTNAGYVIDVNPRINGSTPALLISEEMSHLGLNYGLFKTGCQFAGTEEDLVERVEAANEQGHVRIVILSTTEKESLTFLGAPILEAHIVAYTLIKNDLFTVIDDILKQFDETVV